MRLNVTVQLYKNDAQWDLVADDATVIQLTLPMHAAKKIGYGIGAAVEEIIANMIENASAPEPQQTEEETA